MKKRINMQGRFRKVLKKGIVISGVVARSLIGIGASALLFLGVKKKKARQK